MKNHKNNGLLLIPNQPI